MGFESSRAARRRLAAVAATNKRVQEALSPSAFPGFFRDQSQEDLLDLGQPTSSVTHTSELQLELDELAQDIVSTPGAGGALLAAYAAQARALTMVVEAAKRAGSSPLPAAVLLAAEAALSSPSAFAGLPAI